LVFAEKLGWVVVVESIVGQPDELLDGWPFDLKRALQGIEKHSRIPIHLRKHQKVAIPRIPPIQSHPQTELNSLPKIAQRVIHLNLLFDLD
jgi:hypothetical protein